MQFGYAVHYVEDVVKTVEFYEAAFGLTRKLVKESGLYAEMDTGATLLAFSQERLMSDDYPDFQASRLDGPPCAAEIAFFTDDVQGAFDKAIAAGAVEHVAPHRKAWGQDMAHVRDLNGFLVELCNPPSP